jgi:hypothetical protein
MESIIKGEVLIVGSEYLTNEVLIINQGKKDINLADKLKGLNGKKVTITIKLVK